MQLIHILISVVAVEAAAINAPRASLVSFIICRVQGGCLEVPSEKCCKYKSCTRVQNECFEFTHSRICLNTCLKNLPEYRIDRVAAGS